MTNVGWYEVEEDLETPWGDPRLQTYDYSFAGESGVVAGDRLLSTSDSATSYPIRYHSGTEVWIEVSPAVAQLFGFEAKNFRRLGLGRLRKDWSAPLEPSADRIWVQASQGDAVVVLRPEEGGPSALFHVGPLGQGARIMADWQTWVTVVFFVSDDFLPEPTLRGLIRASIEKRAWGGRVAATAEG